MTENKKKYVLWNKETRTDEDITSDKPLSKESLISFISDLIEKNDQNHFAISIRVERNPGNYNSYHFEFDTIPDEV